ncbi:MAG TPA: GyrI-like domain-containing protein [Candidatus Limnocylindrales bacterium]|jgi:effector-binding domain-containing protein|nr:GyrI-like domain-containing protein [Candidatus Limnocylindrales bacterium]
MNEQITSDQIASVDVAAQRIVSIRDRFAESAIPSFVGSAFGELYGFLADRGIEPAGPPLVVYHEFGTEIDAEVAVPIPDGPALATDTPDAGRVRLAMLPAARVAQTLHVGPYDRLGMAYDRLGHWIEDHGYVPAAPTRERYLNGPDTAAPDDLQTVIEMPIVEAATLAAR